jgi:hypothetical protein
MINDRAYEPAIRVTPPGPLKPEPHILQQPVVVRQPTPPPIEEKEDPYRFDESDYSDEEVVPSATTNVGRNTRDTFIIPPFWGVVRMGGEPGQREYERDNAMRHMLSGDVYYSRRTNSVFAGQSARDAMEYENRNDSAYSPFTHSHNNQVYQRSPRGLPLTPDQVKKLVTVYKGAFKPRERSEAYQLLRELYNIAQRVTPDNHDAAMNYLVQPKVFDPELPSYLNIRLSRCMPRNTPPTATPAPQAGEVMNLEALGLHLLLYNRPGSANPASGVAMDYAFRVGRRSLFGYALGRLISPSGKNISHIFRRNFALLLARPRRYREAIVEYNRAHPQAHFVPQMGPTFTIYRPRMGTGDTNNLSDINVINALLDNRIPPEWVDHAYPYGVIYLNSHYTGTPLNQGLLDAIDNERISRLLRFGTPPAITDWSGWRHPIDAEVLRLYDIMEVESTRLQNRTGDTPDHLQGFNAPSWLLVGQNGMVEYLTNRPQSVAERYATDNPFIPPDYTELNTITIAPSSGNPPGDMATTDVDMPVNAEQETTLEKIAGEGTTSGDVTMDADTPGDPSGATDP